VKAPVGFDGDPIARVELERGEPLAADAFVFACGPWLGRLFPEVVGDRISVTRQEVCFFGTPAGDTRFHDPALPVWLDYGDRVMYGIPARGGHGFKIADDSPGSPFDPTSGSREVSRAGVAAVRTFLAHRFPALADAPLIGSEVCQYETTPDAHFIIDRHPGASNVWITGGGSGHGFKMGPVVGEVVAALVLDGETPEPQYALGRFASAPAAGWQPKWS
jgi:glycine/D-amino acid oxidase-like deaminating enzyme